MSTTPSKRRSASFLGLGCACKDSKSVLVSVSVSSSPLSSDTKSSTATATTQKADTLTLTSPSTSASFSGEETEAAPSKLAAASSLTSTPSFSGLLRQLNELEQDVTSWGCCTPPPSVGEEKKRRPRHQRSCSEGGGGGRPQVEESVAVVKETEDPLGEFRRSMLQMIVEKEIVDGEELRELLRRFLTLNSPRHHDTILRAFAETWEEVFSGYENTPDFLLHRRGRSRNPPPPLLAHRRL